ncbi:chromosome segregation SMC family protein [Streptomyces sp. BI20]|uniref:chromosome segregation SMC family protein n=1 Tax=Streptomyces sp. BI20 TaxID=3403460 RepID=UPI003C712152
MHLKALTLRGFKSFASATTLRFEPGITCVVGPNGSGKSNVVDALSWVMGEQGAKSLRGGKMEDVIFAGSGGRPALGRAEVSLTIDNTDGALPIDYAEVTLTRTMFRNGGSEYRLNGDTCRLLDIQELLSDSGIGREMHVVVGQGQLDSVLHADPMGRRAFIEEAAGVLKHRKRKEKALRKLDAMKANLARVSDLTEELRRQLGPLGRQAAVARRASVIQADLRDARLRLLADDLLVLRRALAAELADEAALRTAKEKAEAELATALREESELEAAVRELGPRVAAARQCWYDLSGLVERVRGTAELAEARVRGAVAPVEEERRGRDPEELAREAERVREREAELAGAAETARAVLEEAVERRTALEEELATEERRLRDAARALADRREGLARLTGRLGAARSRAHAAREGIEGLERARDAAVRRAAEAGAEHAALAEIVAAQEGEEAQTARVHEEERAELAARDAALGVARDTLVDLERRAAAGAARREALALGLRGADGSEALATAGPAGVLGPVADRLTVLPGHEPAVAAALGSAAEALTAGSTADAARALAWLRAQDAGRATLLIAPGAGPVPPARRDPAGIGTAGAGAERGVGVVPRPQAAADERTEERTGGPGTALAGAGAAAVLLDDVPARPVLSVLGGEESVLRAVGALLEGHVLVPDLAAAEELLRTRPELVAVTAEGDVLGARIARGGAAGAPGALQVRAAVDAVDAELAELADRIAELTAAREPALAERAELAERVEAGAARLRESQRARAEVAARLGRLAGQAKGAAEEAERAESAAAGAAGALAGAETEVEECAARLAAAEELSGDGDAQEEPDRTERDRLAAAGVAARQVETDARLRLRTDEERVAALAGRADSLDRAARAEREARSRAEARAARRRREAEVARAVAVGAGVLLARVESALAEAAETRAGAEAERGVRETALAGARDRGRAVKGELDKLTDSVHRGEVLGAEQRMRIEQVETRAREELGVDPETLVGVYGPDLPVPVVPEPDAPADAEPRTVPFVRAEQEKRLKAAERAHEKLGKVNPLALEEYAALEERHAFLGEQLADLRKTRADLLGVVKEVDRRVEQVFSEAFADTACEFEGVFGRLFPGGEGRLVLTDPENMLTTGVDVEARPPGKKVKRLSLLSGGERSLTAVALLVSIFKARPSPFYVMDEVEAALDDTNLQRLIGIMAELRESSQLIVITHQKRTMEVADALYGVSMQGDGVSKVISQRLR